MKNSPDTNGLPVRQEAKKPEVKKARDKFRASIQSASGVKRRIVRKKT